MEETQKPFVCENSSCGQTFTNLDHLNVHTVKHNMILNLGVIGKANTFSDQTPTPTRFIRTCDEVGLFEELQMINPFEQTFKHAVESKKTVNDSQQNTSILTNVDHCNELHTPHVFPLNYIIPDIKNESNNNVDNEGKLQNCIASTAPTCTKIYLPKNLPLKLKLNKKINDTIYDKDNKISEQIPAELMEIKETKRKNTTPSNKNENVKIRKPADIETKPIKILPKVSPSDTIQNILSYESSIKLTDNILISDLPMDKTKIKQKLKAVILQSNSAVNGTKISPKINVQCNIQDTLVSSIATIKTQSVKKQRKRINKSDITNDDGNNNTLPKTCSERNKFAAKRYRDKMKEQHQELIRKNSELDNENKLLHEKVKELEKKLLAHKNCSVTKTMNNNNNRPKMIINCAGELEHLTNKTCENKTSPIFLILSNNDNNNNNNNNNKNETNSVQS